MLETSGLADSVIAPFGKLHSVLAVTCILHPVVLSFSTKRISEMFTVKLVLLFLFVCLFSCFACFLNIFLIISVIMLSGECFAWW